MTPGAEFHPAARLDLLAAVDQSEAYRPGSGQALLDALDKALDRVGLWPESGRPENAQVEDAAIRSVRLPGSRYRVVYLVTAGKLWIVESSGLWRWHTIGRGQASGWIEWSDSRSATSELDVA